MGVGGHAEVEEGDEGGFDDVNFHDISEMNDDL